MKDTAVSTKPHDVDTLALGVPGSVGRPGWAPGSFPC